MEVGAAEQKPNLVYILCDDLGYGDVRCLGGARGKIATPNIDRLAGQGMSFADAHGSSAVCTPTQLYDMSKDVGERTNEYKAHPDIVARLTKLLEKYDADGRSTPGIPQKCDAAIVIRKKNGDSAVDASE